MNYGLPTTVFVDGKDRTIRTDYRVILDIIEAMNDPELSKEEKCTAALIAFYPDYDEIEDFETALVECFRFIDGASGEKPKKSSPRLVDWEKDFERIIAPVNRVLGYEARAVPYDMESNTGGLHWWTFLAAYMEIGGDCVMSQIVSIRDKLKRGKKLEKHEREWYNRNRELVDIESRLSQSQEDIVKEWT